MGDPREFNGVRAAFLLVAFVIVFQCFMVFVGVAACMYWSWSIIEGKTTCAARELLSELLSQAMAAALAFSASFLHRGKGKDNDDSTH